MTPPRTLPVSDRMDPSLAALQRTLRMLSTELDHAWVLPLTGGDVPLDQLVDTLLEAHEHATRGAYQGVVHTRLLELVDQIAIGDVLRLPVGPVTIGRALAAWRHVVDPCAHATLAARHSLADAAPHPAPATSRRR